MEKLLEIRDLHISIGEKSILGGVNLTARAGKVNSSIRSRGERFESGSQWFWSDRLF